VLTPILASATSVYDRAIVDTGRQPEFLFFVAFLITFGFIRTSAHMIRAQVSWWPGNVQVGGTHIHHLVWGIVLLLITGYVGVAIRPPSPWEEVVAIFFGIGTGLTLDEFALWLDLKDVYWAQDGRKSIDAVIIAATISGMVLIGFSAWIDVATQVEDAIFAIVGSLHRRHRLRAREPGEGAVGLRRRRPVPPPGGDRHRVPPRAAGLALGAALLPRGEAGSRGAALHERAPAAMAEARGRSGIQSVRAGLA